MSPWSRSPVRTSPRTPTSASSGASRSTAVEPVGSRAASATPSPRFSPDGRLIGVPPGAARTARPNWRSCRRTAASRWWSPTPSSGVTRVRVQRRRHAAGLHRPGARGRAATARSTTSVPATRRTRGTSRPLQFQLNGVGYTADQRAHVFVVDVPDPHGEPPVKPVGRAAKDGRRVPRRAERTSAVRRATSTTTPRLGR